MVGQRGEKQENKLRKEGHQTQSQAPFTLCCQVHHVEIGGEIMTDVSSG